MRQSDSAGRASGNGSLRRESDVRSSLQRTAAGEGAEAHDLQPGDVQSSPRRAAAGEDARAHDL